VAKCKSELAVKSAVGGMCFAYFEGTIGRVVGYCVPAVLCGVRIV